MVTVAPLTGVTTTFIRSPAKLTVGTPTSVNQEAWFPPPVEFTSTWAEPMRTGALPSAAVLKTSALTTAELDVVPVKRRTDQAPAS